MLEGDILSRIREQHCLLRILENSLHEVDGRLIVDDNQFGAIMLILRTLEDEQSDLIEEIESKYNKPVNKLKESPYVISIFESCRNRESISGLEERTF